jgi:oligoendopeptidase F
MSKFSPHEWNLDLILPNADAAVIQADREVIRAAATAFASRWRDRYDFVTDAAVLRTALDDYEQWQRDFGVDGKSGAYIWLRAQQDQLDPEIKAWQQQATDFANTVMDEIRFFEMRVAKIDVALQPELLNDPILADYRHFLERLFAEARHQLTEGEERIMSLKGDTAHTKWTQLTQDELGRQSRTVVTPAKKEESLTYEDLLSAMTDTDEAYRERAAAAFNDILGSSKHQAVAEMNAILADHKNNDELRGFTRPDAARHLHDDIESDVIYAMLDAVDANNTLSHRFYALKSALLGKTTLKYHERNLEFGDINAAYTYDDAVKLVDEVYSELEPKFGDIFRSFRDHGQIDIYPRPGKRGGAFCVYFTKSEPTYLMLNFTNKLSDVTTLAHEFGHGLNDEYMKSAQNQLNFGTPMATAEVASQFLEDFVLDRLQADADEELQFAIMLSRLNDAVSSIFRQVACYRFEQALHREFRASGYLSGDDIGRLFLDAMGAYMGPSVEQSPGSENWWIYWGHIRNFFYVYSYASGLLIAKAMQRATRRDRAFLARVSDFLSAGLSQSPRDIFQAMDIDIADSAFWNDGLAEIEQLLEATIGQARALGKIDADLVI